LHSVFNVNLLEWYVDPKIVDGHANPPWLQPKVIFGENLLDIKRILDIRKVGCRFEYLVEHVNKPSSETSWYFLTDIPKPYDEVIETFHHRHPKFPHPAFLNPSPKSKQREPPDGPQDVLAPVPSTEWVTDPGYYMPPTWTMTRSGHVVHPPNRDKILEQISR
ncbi:uncharacterized protein EI90DRAFT_2931604, partial [Cantharellus anzutake]|uniref:uncharacterized protein n=1 Tax=Cantharellus anzutake TaxID=1750568 RepID=UPI001903B5F7